MKRPGPAHALLAAVYLLAAVELLLAGWICLRIYHRLGG